MGEKEESEREFVIELKKKNEVFKQWNNVLVKRT